jgi:DNA repair protein RecN (Recombination protein N)
LTEVRHHRAVLGGDRRALERELDMLRFQTTEISDAGFAAGDDAGLETEAVRLRNAEVLGEHLAAAARRSGDEGAAADADVTVRELRLAARTDPSLESLVEQAADVAALFSDLNAEIARAASTMERDPETLAGVESRLALLGDLRRKYGDTLDAVLAFRDDADERVSQLDDLLGRADDLEREELEAVAAVGDAGELLRSARLRSGEALAESAQRHLEGLGFAEPVVRFDLEPGEPAPHGADRITVLFASDGALRPGPVGRIASGGELSRLVLALRLAGSAGTADIVAFDEIDAGVGGATALAMGRKLAALAESRQVLCVTHLPQVAAFATTHVVVTRDANRIMVRTVDGGERIAELSRMLAGLPDSDRGREHAEELLALAAGS